ncbi:hypothetical protein ACWE42_15670 [Sutcliffiella cohnii]
MSLSMSLGLTVGLLFGVIFQGNLFMSTIISIVVAGIFALIVSFAFGILTSVEGLMASLMGAMMGAMLGEMNSTHQFAFLLMFFLVLSICATLLFFVVPTKNNLQNEKVTKKWLLKPLLVTIGLCLFVFLGIQLSHSMGSTPVPPSEHHGHEQHRGIAD